MTWKRGVVDGAFKIVASWVAIGLAGCGAAARELMKQPVVSACESQGLKSCPVIADGVVLYVEGDKDKASALIVKGVAGNSPEQVKSFSKALREILSQPPLADHAGPMTEVLALLEGDSGGSTGAREAATTKRRPPTSAASVDATGSESADAAEAGAPRSKSRPEDDALRRSRTTTVAPTFAREVLPCDQGLLGQGSPCVASRVVTGPLIVTDVHAAGECPDELSILSGPATRPFWYLTSRPAQPLSVHGASLVVAAGTTLHVASRSLTSAPPRRDRRCALTITTQCVGSGECVGASSEAAEP